MTEVNLSKTLEEAAHMREQVKELVGMREEVADLRRRLELRKDKR